MISLPRVKAHLRIDVDDDDAYLNALIPVAVEAFNNTTGRELQPKGTDLSGEPAGHKKLLITEGITQGCLLLIGHWYENREATSDLTIKNIPFAVDCLFQPYKWYAL